ncbi:MAG: bifunctional lysylphosphatidylglycerol flippase/synthetase MprF [Gemmatimonadetes bacterium]|nr:bifunctional lysylphosphatidylglycerol flippase/synthetase MprF [Gemmatimonadota bacterium]
MTVAAPPVVDVEPRAQRWGRWFGILLGALVFAVALYALREQFATYNVRQIRHTIRNLDAAFIVQGTLFAVAAYAVLVTYDILALRYIKHDLPAPRVAFISFIAFSFSNALGFPLLLGGGLRYRLYNAAGLSSADIAMTIAFNSVTFWLGVLSAGGGALLLAPSGSADVFGVPLLAMRLTGVGLLLVVVAYQVACLYRRSPLRILGWEFLPPSGRMAAAQIAVAAFDWALVAAVLWAVIPQPPPTLAFGVVLGAFVIAQVASLVSHVPGGLGVFEVTFIALLHEYVEPTRLLSAVIIFRIIYYLLPLVLALVLLAANELSRGRSRLARVARLATGWVPVAAPALFSLTTFIGGAILLFSGATPEMRSRLRFIGDLMPLAVIESSHFVASLTGAALLVLAYGLGRRLDAAYYLTLFALPIGIVTSLLKGWNYEEAAVLTVILLTLIPARRHFYRRARLTAEFMSFPWLLMTGTVLALSGWLGFFAYKNVPYSNELWWRFALRADAPRFLRSLVGVSVGVALLAMHRLLRPVRIKTVEPDPATLDRVESIVRASPDTLSYLALLGDKSLLFSEDGTAFVMYGVEGQSFVAMGDPVGPPRHRKDLAWEFRALADRNGAHTVFYQVRMHNLPLYLDMGLSLLKLGEEGRVPLRDFTLDGGARRRLRRTVRVAEAEGGRFEILRGAAVDAILPQLRTVSDEWLATRGTREKGFSLGYWNERYLRSTTIAVVRRGDEIVAFANLWEGAEREEVTVDLMRYTPRAPEGAMEYLFVQMMLWGRDEGFAHFNLGMAPLSGLENRQLAPIWNRVGSLLFKHTENFYNFQGLRAFKQKFDPVWEPRYLASRSGLALPGILTNVSTLVSRGLRGAISK